VPQLHACFDKRSRAQHLEQNNFLTTNVPLTGIR